MRTEKFKNLFWFAPKSKIKAGDGLDKGNLPFYTSSPKLTKWIDKEQYFGEALIFGTGGLASIHFEDQPFSTSTDCIVAMTTNNEIKTKFVYYYLLENIHLLERGFRGAGLKHISKKYIGNLDIPVLSIETQNKIVAILDKASALLKKREESITMLDDLLKSTFLDMFGDPVINEKGWKISSMNKVVVGITSGTSYGGEERTQLKSNELGVLKISAVTKGTFDPLQIKAVPKDQIKKEVLKLKKGMFLLSRANTRDLVAACCIIDQDYPNLFLPDKLWSLDVDIKIIQPEYLNYLFKNENYRKLIAIKASGGHESMLNISMKKFRSLNLPIPSINIQNEFNNIVLKNDVLKKVLIRSHIELENLKRVLCQKVFNGQLNFNIDFELDSLIHEIDLKNSENDLSKITGDIAYLQRLVDRLNNQEFKEKDLYDKAKHGAFQLMAIKEEGRKVTQEYDEKSKSIKLALK